MLFYTIPISFIHLYKVSIINQIMIISNQDYYNIKGEVDAFQAICVWRQESTSTNYGVGRSGGLVPDVAKVLIRSPQIGERERWPQSLSRRRVFDLRWLRRQVKRRKLFSSGFHMLWKLVTRLPSGKVEKAGLKMYRVSSTSQSGFNIKAMLSVTFQIISSVL